MQELFSYFEAEKAKKLENYRQLNRYVRKGQILFTGSSLMEQFPISEYCADFLPGKIVYNRGIGGYTSDDFLKAADVILLAPEPARIFLNIGTNDIHPRDDGRDWLTLLSDNYRSILTLCRDRLPDSEIHIMAFYPVNEDVGRASGNPVFQVRTNRNIRRANACLQMLAKEYGVSFLDANSGLTDENGNLCEFFTMDGIHMYASAYRIVFENIKKYL